MREVHIIEDPEKIWNKPLYKIQETVIVPGGPVSNNWMHLVRQFTTFSELLDGYRQCPKVVSPSQTSHKFRQAIALAILQKVGNLAGQFATCALTIHPEETRERIEGMIGEVRRIVSSDGERPLQNSDAL